MIHENDYDYQISPGCKSPNALQVLVGSVQRNYTNLSYDQNSQTTDFLSGESQYNELQREAEYNSLRGRERCDEASCSCSYSPEDGPMLSEADYDLYATASPTCVQVCDGENLHNNNNEVLSMNAHNLVEGRENLDKTDNNKGEMLLFNVPLTVQRCNGENLQDNDVEEKKAVGSQEEPQEITSVSIVHTPMEANSSCHSIGVYDNCSVCVSVDENLYGNDEDVYGNDEDVYGNAEDAFDNDCEPNANPPELIVPEWFVRCTKSRQQRSNCTWTHREWTTNPRHCWGRKWKASPPSWDVFFLLFL